MHTKSFEILRLQKSSKALYLQESLEPLCPLDGLRKKIPAAESRKGCNQDGLCSAAVAKSACMCRLLWSFVMSCLGVVEGAVSGLHGCKDSIATNMRAWSGGNISATVFIIILLANPRLFLHFFLCMLCAWLLTFGSFYCDLSMSWYTSSFVPGGPICLNIGLRLRAFFLTHSGCWQCACLCDIALLSMIAVQACAGCRRSLRGAGFRPSISSETPPIY